MTCTDDLHRRLEITPAFWLIVNETMHYLIVNPVAGRGFALKAKAQVEAYFLRHEEALRVYHTSCPGHATEIVRGLPEDARVLALGGDGTVHEVAAACLATARVLGVLPAGSGDDFAMALGLAHHDIAAALDIIRQGTVSRVDTALVNGQPFVNSLGTGFDADVAYTVRQAPGLFRGPAAYFYAILATLGRFATVNANVQTDGQDFYQGPALLVAMQNGPRTAGSFLFCPEAQIDDGYLDVIVAGRFGRLGVLSLLPRVMKGKHLSHPEVFYTRAKRVTVRWQEARVAHMEGELLAASKSFEIELCPASLRVFKPEK